MQTFHTPGPWRTVMAYGYKIKAADGTIIAALPTHCPLTWESPANAYLVAAAPDLLAACNLVLDDLNGQLELDDRTQRMLRSAIAKATGQDSAPANDRQPKKGISIRTRRP